MPLTHLLRLCCSQCLLIFLLRDDVAVWVFLSVCQEVSPLAVVSARPHVRLEMSPLMTEVVAGRTAEWHDGQLKRGAGQEGSSFDFMNTSNLSTVKKPRWGMSTI